MITLNLVDLSEITLNIWQILVILGSGYMMRIAVEEIQSRRD